MEYEYVTLIGETAFSELVEEVYSRPYRLQQHGRYGEPMAQDSMIRVTVPAESEYYDSSPTLGEWLDTEVVRDADGHTDFDHRLWWYREFYPDLQDLVNDLHDRELLEAGDYVIHIWW